MRAMRRTGRIALAACVLALIGVLAAVVQVGVSLAVERDREQVTVRESTGAGDRSALAGLTLTMRADMDNRLFWDNTLSFDGERCEVESVYTCYPAGKLMASIGGIRSVELNADFDTMLSADVEDETALSAGHRYVREVYAAMAPGEKRELAVPMSDFYEYYPLEIEIFSRRVSAGGLSEHDELGNAFVEYFRIPVLSGEIVTLSLQKAANGAHHAYATGIGSEGECFRMSSVAYVTFDAESGDGTAWFTFSPVSSRGNTVDLSLLPDGYGLFAVDFETNAYGQREALPDTLRCAVPLPTDLETVELGLIEGGEEPGTLYYLARRRLPDGGAQQLLYLIDPHSGEMMQLLEPTPPEDRVRYYDVWTGEDMMVLRHYDGGQYVTVISREADGHFAVTMEAGVSDEEIAALPDALLYADRGTGSVKAMAYDGERLAIATFAIRSRGEDALWTYCCDVTLTVWGREGRLYSGTWQTSLNTDGEDDQTAVLPSEGEALRLAFARP